MQRFLDTLRTCARRQILMLEFEGNQTSIAQEMSGIYICEGCGAVGGDFASVQKHQLESVQKHKQSDRVFLKCRKTARGSCKGTQIFRVDEKSTRGKEVAHGVATSDEHQEDLDENTGTDFSLRDMQGDPDFSDEECGEECKGYDVCEYLRIGKRSRKSDTVAWGVESQKSSAMIDSSGRPGSRVSVVGRVLDLNESERAVYAYLVTSGTTVNAARNMLQTIQDPAFLPSDLRFASLSSMHFRMYMSQEYSLFESDLHRDGDGNQDVRLWYRKAGESLHQMVKSKRWGPHIQWHFEKTFNEEGHRTYTSLNSSLWMENVTGQKQRDLPHWDTGVSILGVLIGSDGTCIKKRLGGRPLYVSIGNIATAERAKPAAWRFLGWIPEIDETKMDGYSSTSKAHKWRYQRRCRQILCESVWTMLADVIFFDKQEEPQSRQCGDGHY